MGKLQLLLVTFNLLCFLSVRHDVMRACLSCVGPGCNFYTLTNQVLSSAMLHVTLNRTELGKTTWEDYTDSSMCVISSISKSVFDFNVLTMLKFVTIFHICAQNFPRNPLNILILYFALKKVSLYVCRSSIPLY